MSQLRWWVPRLIIPGLIETKTPSNAWNVRFPSLNAISCSQWLFPLITLTLNSICLIKLKTQVAQNKVRVYSSGGGPGPATTNVALNFTECHLLTGTQERPSVSYRQLELCRKGKRGNWNGSMLMADHAWPVISLMWVARASPEQRQSGVGSRQDVFNEPQHISTVACQQPSSLLRTRRWRNRQRDRKPDGEFTESRKRHLGNNKSKGGHDLRKILWLTDIVLRVQVRNVFSFVLTQALTFFFFHFLSSFIWPRLPLPSDLPQPWPQGGAAAVSHRRASSCGSSREKNSSHHYHDICKLRWWFSNCEFWYATYCFTYSKLLFQTLPGANTSK